VPSHVTDSCDRDAISSNANKKTKSLRQTTGKDSARRRKNLSEKQITDEVSHTKESSGNNGIFEQCCEHSK